MSTRVSPLERVRAEIDDLFASDRDLGDVLEEVARLGVRLLMQTAVEAEAAEFLGRERYARGGRARPGSRNGHCPTTVKTTAGPVIVDRPKLRGADEAFASRLLGVGVCRTNALESLVIAGFVRGLSVRDVEATLAEALGSEATLSKSTVSRVCEGSRPSSTCGSAATCPTSPSSTSSSTAATSAATTAPGPSPVLAAWGMTTEGRPVLVGLEPGASESTDAWRGFLDGMVDRGLRPPLLVVSDGAPGLIGAVELVFAHSLRQRCLIHRARNVLAKAPVEHQDEVEKAFWALFEDTGAEPGEQAIAIVRARAERFAAAYAKRFPAAVECLIADFAGLTTCLRFPAGHHARIRHSNFIERTFGETRRRVKVIGRLPGERTCLGLVWAVLDRASRGWRGVVMTPPPPASSRTCAVSCSTRRPPGRRRPSPPKLSQSPRRLTSEEPALVSIYTAHGTPPVPRQSSGLLHRPRQ